MAVKPEIVKIEAEIFTPALQQAMQQAKDSGYTFNETIMGAANAYINMLVELLDKEKALDMLKNQASFLESQQD